LIGNRQILAAENRQLRTNSERQSRSPHLFHKETSAMKSVCALCLLALCLHASLTLPAQQPPQPTDLPSHPFFIKQTWVVGGAGPWDYLTIDPVAERLYIAHGHAVQVVDVKSGSVVGEISGLAEAHAIALDDSGEFGYISDGAAGKVVAFDRRSLQTVATIESNPNPRALVFDPQTKLLFAVRTDPAPATPTPDVPRTRLRPSTRPEAARQPSADLHASSSVTVIDTQTQTALGQVLLSGTLGYAQANGRGQVFVSVTDRNQIVRLDAEAVAALLRKPQPETASQAPAAAPAPASAPPAPGPQKQSAPGITVDWTQGYSVSQVRSFSLASGCTDPKSLAIDGSHARLFVACASMKMVVLNAETGETVAALPTGPGVEMVGYDPGRSLIYAANGGAEGSLTIIRQSVTDTYSVIQNLPTRQRARTLAVNPDTGQVYLVTDLLGMNLAQSGGIGTLQTNPVNGSFQVLVVGN
jgi:DNA-binding beta-propeller fold protein YncE